MEGKFTPDPKAKDLSTAAHFHCASTPVVARFSVGGGLPYIPDSADGATPKGLAIRFLVDEDTHTDMITHTFDGFATRTGEEFLEFLNIFKPFQDAKGALEKASPQDKDYAQKQAAAQKAGAALGAFAGRCPSAGVFLNPNARPNPYTYGTVKYYQPNTHILTNSEGEVSKVRYRLIPADGEHLYTKDEIAKLTPNYLEDDLKSRFPSKPIVFTIEAHIAGPDDTAALIDATTKYKSTTYVTVGKLEINKVSDDNAAKQQEIAFSPIPSRGGIKGIQPSEDPLIATRKGVYYISSSERRHEKQKE